MIVSVWVVRSHHILVSYPRNVHVYIADMLRNNIHGRTQAFLPCSDQETWGHRLEPEDVRQMLMRHFV